MNADRAIALFGAYGAILGIVVVYQALALQAIYAEITEIRDSAREDRERLGRTRRSERRRWVLARLAWLVLIVTMAFGLICMLDLELAFRVRDLPGMLLSLPTLALGSVFVAITVFYVVVIGANYRER